MIRIAARIRDLAYQEKGRPHSQAILSISDIIDDELNAEQLKCSYCGAICPDPHKDYCEIS